MLGAFSVQTISAEQGAGDRQQAQHLPAAQRGLAEYLENVRQQRNPRTKQHQSNDVQRIVAQFAIVRQMPINHVETAQANWDIDEKNHAPMKISDDRAADD